MKKRFEAIVVGAGPAGCACSYALAKAGLETLLVERGKFPGAKNIWGGAFYGPSLNRLFPQFWKEAPVERYILRHKFSLLTKEASLSAEFTTKKFSKPPYNGFALLRSKFDRWFASKAEQAGAVVSAVLQEADLLWGRNQVAGIKAGGDEIPSDVVCDLPRDIFPRLIDSGRLYGFPLSGYRCAVDSPGRLAEARAAIADGRYTIQPCTEPCRIVG